MTTPVSSTSHNSPLTVLVLAVGGNVSQGILKALAKSTLNVRVLGADISAMKMGLYTVDRAYVSPWANQPEFLPWLIKVCKDEKVDVVLSGAEPVLHILSIHKNEIEGQTQAFCLVSDPVTFQIGDDKLRTCQWLDSQGLRTPRYADASDQQAVSTLIEECGYPLIAKPRKGGGAHGIFSVQKVEDAILAADKGGYLLQEYVGTEDEEYTVGCFCDRHQNIRGSIVMKRDLLAGTTFRAVIGDFPEMRQEAESITAALAPMGPCNIQMRLDKYGPVCFEINARFSGTTPMRAHFGFNEVEWAIRHFVLGEDMIDLPLVTEGIALRYWNELYIDAGSCRQLGDTGSLDRPGTDQVALEDYGLES
mgnify:CR=1 FL=1